MLARAFALSILIAAMSGCSSSDEEPMPGCIELTPSCAPLYAPTFDELFTRTLRPTCGQAGSSCHAAEGANGDLVFADANQAYAALTSGEKPRVVPGDPACSEIVVRTHRAGEPWSMPPGQALSEGEQCVIRQWIEQGALR